MKSVAKIMSPRMLMIADSVRPCKKVFDAGSDHAFIPIYLIQNNICEKAVASDVRIGPIAVAQKNIKKYSLEDRISLSHCDGITNAAESDCIIIAGMGGQLISEILERENRIALNAKQLILQPMNAPEKLRRYLWDNGFKIYFENLCREKHKVYNVICTVFTGIEEQYNERDLHASKYLIETDNALLNEYLQPKYRRLSDMVNGGNDPNSKNSILLREIKELME